MKQISIIPIAKLHAFEGHPYKVLDNEEMNDLIESIQDNGILTPLLVRPLEGTKDEYEVISGHRRLHAAQKAGMKTIPAFIYPLDRDEASVLLVDSNLHREHILPSEKAFAYKLKLDALNHQGRTSGQVGQKWSRDQVSETESGRTVQRYIRLTELVPPLLNLIDEGRMAVSVGVELSFLDRDSQEYIAEVIERDEITPSYSQAARLRKESGAYNSYDFFDQIEEIMGEEKPNPKEQIRLRREDFSKYFPRYYTEQQLEEDIIAGIDLLHRQRVRERDRGAR